MIQKQRLIELVRSNRVEEALAYAQTEIAARVSNDVSITLCH